MPADADRVVSVSGTERGHDTRPGERDALIDFCAHLETQHGLNVPTSWAAMVDSFLVEYDPESVRSSGSPQREETPDVSR